MSKLFYVTNLAEPYPPDIVGFPQYGQNVGFLNGKVVIKEEFLNTQYPTKIFVLRRRLNTIFDANTILDTMTLSGGYWEVPYRTGGGISDYGYSSWTNGGFYPADDDIFKQELCNRITTHIEAGDINWGVDSGVINFFFITIPDVANTGNFTIPVFYQGNYSPENIIISAPG